MSDFCVENCDVEKLSDFSQLNCDVRGGLNLYMHNKENRIYPRKLCEFVLKYARRKSFQECLTLFLEDSPSIEDEIFIKQLQSASILYQELVERG